MNAPNDKARYECRIYTENLSIETSQEYFRKFNSSHFWENPTSKMWRTSDVILDHKLCVLRKNRFGTSVMVGDVVKPSDTAEYCKYVNDEWNVYIEIAPLAFFDTETNQMI